ncbi:putative mitochondrial protein [Vitis vinifera]|uniref:Putative mitochondrial protein n=1 Tax=Vitis vinifera TaxID=29760 RepID=A0A438D9Y1_VITVI|nr:putative mitochondrial protein [Vitis vinifera]
MRIQSESSLSLSIVRNRKRCSGEGTSSSRGEASLHKPYFEEDKEGFWVEWGPIFVVHQSRICLLIQKSESLEYAFHPSCGLALPLPSPSGPDLLSSLTKMIPWSPIGEFQIEGLFPRKMAKVREVLSSLDIKVYSRRKNRCSTGMGLGSRKKRRVVKDFLRSENPDVVMIQETKKVECDRSLQEALPRRTSDHWPIVLDTNLFKWGPTPFRRNRKFIKVLENESGLVLNNSESITEEILLYFEKLYASPIGESWSVEGFRPISLITSLYKIIAKVLSGRLRGVLHETIHSTQGAFVQGRQILDAILIANEIVDEKRRSGEEGVVFKIDFLRPFLVNGNAKGWVKASRGLRQGDPLSIFLFNLVADVLSRMLLRAEERSLLEGFRVGRNRTRVSHLQFADDTIFFSNTREEELQTLKSLLLVFGHISRLTLTRVIFKASILIRIIFLGWLSCLIARLLVSLYSIWVFLWEGIPRLVAFGIQ